MKVGATLNKIEVSLRIMGQELVPCEVTKLLGCEPDEAFTKGHLLSERSGARARQGLWSVTSREAGGEGLSANICRLLARTTSDPGIWRSLTRTFECDVLVGGWASTENPMMSLSREALSALVARELSLEFDLYVSVRTSDE